MPIFRHELYVERPIEAVFAAVADVHTHPKWQMGLIEADAKEGALGVGEKGVEVRRIFGRSVRFHYEITHLEPLDSWGFRVLEGPILLSALLRFKSTEVGTSIASQLTISGVVGWLLGPIMLHQQKRNYQRLKALLETRKL
jgi:uncharacterized protein YndB with AHSA1/START domain